MTGSTSQTGRAGNLSRPSRRKPALLWLKVLLPLLLLAGAVAGFAALVASRERPQPLAVEEKAWLVEVDAVQISEARPNALLYGRLESPRVARLSAAIAADVVEVATFEGKRVEAGQSLVRLDDRDMQLVLQQRAAEVAEIEAQVASEHTRHAADIEALDHEQRLLELAEREVERIEGILRRNLGSQAEIDVARQALERQGLALVTRRLALQDHPARLASLKSRLTRSRALYEQAKLDLERTTVRAPFGGRVTGVEVAVGDRVRIGDALLELFDPEAVEVRAQIPSRYIPLVTQDLVQGQSLQASAELDGRTVHLVLDRMAGRAGKASGGVDALFRIVGDAGRTIGRTLPLVLELPEEAGIVELPYEAVYGLDRVYRLVDGRMEALQVERVGERRGPGGSVRVLVRSPALTPGDQVIVTQLPNAVSGLKVRVNADG